MIKKLRYFQFYADLIFFCFSWAWLNTKLRLIACLLKGIVSAAFVYVALGALALLANSLQVNFEGASAPSKLLYEQSFQFSIVAYLFFSILSAWLQRAFYKDSYQLWATHSAKTSQSFLETVDNLPSPRYAKLNRYCIDQSELMRSSSGRPRALGAFGHYSRVVFIELLKVLVFGITLVFLAPKFTAVIILCFLLVLPWIILSHKKSADLSQEIETQQKVAAIERNVFLTSKETTAGHTQTQKFFELLTDNYLQAKSNLLYSTVANIFAVVLVLVFVLLDVNNGDHQLSYWIAVIVLGRLLAASVMQLSASLILMSRQAPLAHTIKTTLEQFNSVNNSIDNAVRSSAGENNNGGFKHLYGGINSLWVFQLRVHPDIDCLNAMLYVMPQLNVVKQAESILFNLDYIENEGDTWIDILLKTDPVDVPYREHAGNCGFKPLVNALDRKNTDTAPQFRAAKIQAGLVLNLVKGKRIFLPSNLLWVVDLAKLEPCLINHKAQLFIYFSPHSLADHQPSADVDVLEYVSDQGASISKNFVFSANANEVFLTDLDMSEIEG